MELRMLGSPQLLQLCAWPLRHQIPMKANRLGFPQRSLRLRSPSPDLRPPIPAPPTAIGTFLFMEAHMLGSPQLLQLSVRPLRHPIPMEANRLGFPQRPTPSPTPPQRRGFHCLDIVSLATSDTRQRASKARTAMPLAPYAATSLLPPRGPIPPQPMASFGHPAPPYARPRSPTLLTRRSSRLPHLTLPVSSLLPPTRRRTSPRRTSG